MKRKTVIQVLIPIFLIMLHLPVVAVKKNSYCSLVNPGSKKIQGHWKRIINKKDLSLWAEARGLVLKDDQAPVKDNLAGVPALSGTELVFPGLSDGFYYLAIDIVNFHYKNRFSLQSRLIINVRNKWGKESQLRTIAFQDSFTNPVIIPIPYEFSVTGTITIIIRESGSASGAWAIWDCYLYKNKICTDR